MQSNFKKLISVLSSAALCCTMIYPAGLNAYAEDFAEIDTWTGFMIYNQNSGKYLTVKNGLAQEGTGVCQYEADGVSGYNTWYFTKTDNGYYTLKSALDEGQFYLTENEDKFCIGESNNSAKQEFGLINNGNGTYRIIANTDGENNVLQVADASAENGADVAAAQTSADSNQEWIIEPVTNIRVADIDGNAELNAFDAAAAKKSLLYGKGSFVKKAIADADGNGLNDYSDVLAIKKYLLAQSLSFENTEVVLPDNSITPYVKEEPVIEKEITLSDMPAEYKDAIEWVWENRILDEQSTARKNLIFDQIIAGDGTLNYVVRWQSSKPLSLEQRQRMASMISTQINNWTKNLINYDGWEYDEIQVKIVGWAVADSSLILDPQPDEIIYTSTITDGLHAENSAVPELLPCAPDELSRAEHFYDSSYSYPGGIDKRFDMYLWGTTGFEGGAGGDWGQRVSDDYILEMITEDAYLNESEIIEHEIGHGFGITDFYGDDERPPQGFPENTIMWAGDSAVITQYDAWTLRYIWSQIKDEQGRFGNS
jgi:hypothetical protein